MKPVRSHVDAFGHYRPRWRCLPVLALLSIATPVVAQDVRSELDLYLASLRDPPPPSAPPAHPVTATPTNAASPLRLHGVASANAVLIRALSLVGTPYQWGGSGPQEGFDCSGLVNYVYRDMLDLRLPRNSQALAAWQGPRIARDALRTGDLVFFGEAGVISHVGIYVGDGRFVHAPRTGTTVRMDRLDGTYWNARYSGAKRVLSES